MNFHHLLRTSAFAGFSIGALTLPIGCGPSNPAESDSNSGSESSTEGDSNAEDSNQEGSEQDSKESSDGTQDDNSGEDSGDNTTSSEESDASAEESDSGESSDGTQDDATDSEDSNDEDTPDSEDSDSESDSDDSDTNVEPDDLFSDVEVSVHPEVANILVVSWEQKSESESSWIKFTFENDEWYTSLPEPGKIGKHKAPILGVPGDTEVTFQLVAKIGSQEIEDETRKSTNGKVPSRMPRPTIVSYDDALASENRWMLGGISSTGYQGPFWIYIIDREGRIVWYYRDAEKERLMAFPRISQDHTYIGIERRDGNKKTDIHFLGLDFEYSEEVDLPDMCDAFDIIDDGSIVYNTLERENPGQNFLDGSRLNERTPDGKIREIWDCEPWARNHHGDGSFKRNWCYSNTVFWDKASDSVLLSMPYYNTVLQIDRKSGDIVSEWGDLGDWKFDPSSLGFDFNHWANITKEGTLLVSSHLPGQSKAHRFMEFEIDRDNKTLKEKWMFGEGFSDFPQAKGMVERVDNGNTLVNYGTDGVIREVTPDGDVAWELNWRSRGEPVEQAASTRRAKQMVGHNILINDLYGLTRGKSYVRAGTSGKEGPGNTN